MAQAPSLYVILPHSTETKILVLPCDSGWTLPQIQPEGDLDELFDFFEFGMKIQSVEGCAVIALCCPFVEEADDAQEHRLIFVLENCDPSFQPPQGACWMSAHELDDVAPDYLRPTLATYFRERETGVYPLERAPWAFPGWQDQVHEWIREQVAVNDWTLEGEIEMVRKWCITCVIKAPTSAGNLYFKAVPPTFAREVPVTRLLARHHPLNVPTIVAADDARRWMLMRDFGESLLGESEDVADWERTLRDFAALQITMSGQIEALFQYDALDNRLEVLPDKFDALLADTEILKPNHQITAEEIERTRQLAPRIKELIAELQAYSLPATIVHSDFHIWNIAVNNSQTIFFDWTDASVGHPFFDLAPFFNTAGSHVFADQPETLAHLREVYLQAWTSIAPIETLRKALPLGEMLGVLEKAVNYRHLLRCLEPAEHWSLDHTGGAVKELLTRVEAYQEA